MWGKSVERQNQRNWNSSRCMEGIRRDSCFQQASEEVKLYHGRSVTIHEIMALNITDWRAGDHGFINNQLD